MRAARVGQVVERFVSANRQELLLIAAVFLFAIWYLQGPGPYSGPVGEGVLALESCTDGEHSIECYEEVLREHLQEEGVEGAVLFYEEALRESALVRRDCHQIAHALGREALAYTGELTALFEMPRRVETCAGGFYHGVVEGMFRGGSSAGEHIGEEEIAAVAPAVCAEFVDEDRVSACVHGVGHGALYVLQDMERSLGVCGRFGTVSERFSCYSGVFMEFSLSGLSVRENSDPHFPCSGYGGQRELACYYVHVFHLRSLKMDPSEIVQTCSEAGGVNASFCMRGYGIFVLAHEALAGDEAEVRAFCEGLLRTFSRVCAEAVASRLVSHTGTGEIALPFCSRLSTAYLRGRCYTYATDVLRLSHGVPREKLREECVTLVGDPAECVESIRD